MGMRWRLMLLLAVLGVSCRPKFSLPKGVSWDERSGRFAWWGGEVTVPRGFQYQVDAGEDTFQGHFRGRSPGEAKRELVIHHDIGSYAGAWARQKRAAEFAERVVEGSRVWIARKEFEVSGRGTETLVAVTFPDAGCANFYLSSSRVEDAKLIAEIAQSFRPKLPKGQAAKTDLCR